MIAELDAGALNGVSGLVRYDDAFSSVWLRVRRAAARRKDHKMLVML